MSNFRAFPLLKLVATIALVLVLVDVLVFRSGAYAYWLDPDSTAGSVVRADMSINRYFDASRKNVLVLGNSKIGEGFSAPIANASSGRDDVHFINGAIAGTSPRVWDYLLRKMDPNANRFAAIAMMIDYDIAHQSIDQTNYPLDTSYAMSLLRLGDVADYPNTFTDMDQRERARRAIVLPLQALHDDVLDSLTNPLKRLHAVRFNRSAWIESSDHYAGRPEALPDLDIDSASGMPRSWGEHEAQLKPRLEGYFHDLRTTVRPELQAANNIYLGTWVGDIAERYRAHGIPVIVFCIPRGPWHHLLAPTPEISPAIAGLRDANKILTLPDTAFTELEQPQFFFDHLHMNHAGRERFSAMFAQQVAPLVP